MAASAFPSVEADVMVIAPGRNERRARTQALHHFEAEHPAVKPERAIEIGDLEMDMPDAGAGDDGGIGHVVSPLAFFSPLPARGERSDHIADVIRVRGPIRESVAC